MEYHWIKIKGRKQAHITSATDEGMTRREAKIPINLTKGHSMLMFNDVILHLLIYFVILLIILVSVVYANHI